MEGKKYISKTKTQEHIYPVIYTVKSNSEPTLHYSSERKSFFGVSKFVWSNGRITSIGSYIDNKGEYGLGAYAYGIVEENEDELKLLKKCFDSKKFRNLMCMCAVGQLSVNYKILSLFKTRFWKEFI